MPTSEYYNAKGERIPGNTTVISSNLGWSKDGLMYWAWQQGKEGKNFRQTRDDAADAGTLAHAMVEADIKGTEGPLKQQTEIWIKALKAFDNYLEWKRQMQVELLDMEVACVSEKIQAGTTIDIIAKVAARRSIVEVKTSNNIYSDFLIQMAFQKEAWEETHPTEPIEAIHLLKIGKEEATFSHHWWAPEVLDNAFTAFKYLRGLHDLKKELKRLL